jgi:hypothetical protein
VLEEPQSVPFQSLELEHLIREVIREVIREIIREVISSWCTSAVPSP